MINYIIKYIIKYIIIIITLFIFFYFLNKNIKNTEYFSQNNSKFCKAISSVSAL